MMDKIEILKEANRRGILPENKKALYSEAVKRGLISEAPDMMPSHVVGAPSSVIEDRQSGENIMGYVRPALEGAGAALGGIAGAGAGLGVASPLTAVAGGGLGYAIGKKGADIIEEGLGLRTPKPLAAAALESVSDIGTGAMYEMGGQVLAPGFFAVKAGGKWVFNKLSDPIKKAFTESGAERAASEILKANTSSGPIYAKNAMEAAEIEKQIPGIKFTAGQRTNDPALIKLERAQMRSPGDAAELNAEQIARNNEALRSYYSRNFGGEEGVDDLVSNLQKQRSGLEKSELTAREVAQSEAAKLPAVEPAQTGQRIVSTLEAGAKQAKGTAQEAYSQVPYEEVTTQRVLDSANAIRNRTSPELAGNIPERANFAAREYALDPRTGTEFGPYADALMDEARLIKTGEHGAKYFDGQKMNRSWTSRPSWFTSSGVSSEQAAGALSRAAEGKSLSDIDRQLVENAIDSIRRRPGMEGYFRQQSEKSLFPEGKDIPFQRIVDFKSTLTDELRALKSSGANPRQERDLTQLLKSVEKTISEAEESGSPAASTIKKANALYRQYKETFLQRTVGDILRSGARGEKTKIPLSQIPGKVWTARNLSAADDFIKAAPDQATDIMREHAAYDLLRNATDAEGNIVTSKLNGWLAKNRPLLDKFGIKDDFSMIAKAQKAADEAGKVAAEFERSVAARVLNSDPERAVAAAFSGRNAGGEAARLMAMVKNDAAAKKGLQNAFADHLVNSIQTTAKDISGNPVVSSAAFQKTMAKYAPVMREIYRGEPEKIAALNTMRKAYEIATRNTRSPIGGGSDTAENIMAELSKANYLSRTVSIVKAFGRLINKHGDKKVNELINRALFDPEYAQALIGAARSKVPEKELAATLEGKIIKLDAYRKNRAAAAVAGGLASGDE